MSAQDMSAQLMAAQDMSAQDMEAHDWSAQDMSLQLWSAQDMEFHDMLARAAFAQLIESNATPEAPARPDFTNWSRPRFAFGGVPPRAAARLAVSSPRPADRGLPMRTARAVFISAPLIWSGVQLGCRASICATVPATIGAANDVPESSIRSEPTMFAALSTVRDEPGAIGPTM